LHARAFRKHRALHRPRRVETELALGALLGVGDGDEADEAEKQCDGRGHAQDSHGWTSLIGAIMRHSDPAGRYQTMPDRALSTLARAGSHRVQPWTAAPRWNSERNADRFEPEEALQIGRASWRYRVY